MDETTRGQDSRTYAIAKIGNVQSRMEVDEYINEDEWFGETWLILIGCGFDAHRYVVEADDAGSAIDEFVDSEHGHLLTSGVEPCDRCLAEDHDYCICSFGGNYGERYESDRIRHLSRCDVEKTPSGLSPEAAFMLSLLGEPSDELRAIYSGTGVTEF